MTYIPSASISPSISEGNLFFPNFFFFYWEGDHFLNPESTSLGYSPGLNSPAIQRKWLMFTVVVISNYMHWLMEFFFFFLGLFIYLFWHAGSFSAVHSLSSCDIWAP